MLRTNVNHTTRYLRRWPLVVLLALFASATLHSLAQTTADGTFTVTSRTEPTQLCRM